MCLRNSLPGKVCNPIFTVHLFFHNDCYTGIANGYPCFVISIAMIGLCTAVIGDVAGHLGCFIFLKDSVNAIAFVALGTSVPGRIVKKDQNLIPLFSEISVWHFCIAFHCKFVNE